MKVLTIAALAVCTQLSGCWFVFIPGSLIAKASDAVTGAEGDHCVGSAVKVGDRTRSASGQVAVVKSLSGTSVRCTNPEQPIRALVAFE